MRRSRRRAEAGHLLAARRDLPRRRVPVAARRRTVPRAAVAETPTPGYDLLKAEVSYKSKLDPSRFGAREMIVGLLGNNLLNENIRNSVSYNNDEVLLPGIGVRAFANFKF
jgi:hypothetical protein